MTLALRLEHPDQQVHLAFQDEARFLLIRRHRTGHSRFGLKPTHRKRWVPKGERPTAPSRTGYEWTYLYGVVRPETGETFYLILPYANTAMMDLFLDEYARSLPKDVLVVLVLDGAGWPTTGKLKVPENLRLVGLPPYSPELNPAERLWHLQREATSNRAFKDLDELEDVLCDRCVELSKHKEMIRSATSYEGDRLPPTSTLVIQA